MAGVSNDPNLSRILQSQLSGIQQSPATDK